MTKHGKTYKKGHSPALPLASPRHPVASQLKPGTKLELALGKGSGKRNMRRRSARLSHGDSSRQVVNRWVAGQGAELTGSEYMQLPVCDDDDEDEQNQLEFASSGTPAKEVLIGGIDCLFSHNVRSPALVHCGITG
mmetsp:Transcript_45853/g.120239  ORF Transcript_45853/g.120239 Transcript_45853/m.120239 type:complete len:136 (+) Transcript_45853:50-457(+)